MKFLRNIGNAVGKFFTGTPEKRENVSLLRPEQEGLYKQLLNTAKGRPSSGAFGEAGDYYRNLLSDENEDLEAFSSPAMRQYYQDIVPNISEQFAGMGSGGLSSSGFRNAQTQGGVDLAERLGALRANLRQSGAQGLANIGQLGLNPYSQNMVTQAGTPGFLSSISPAIGSGIGSAIGAPIGSSIGSGMGNWISGRIGSNSSPYGMNGPQASPTSFETGNRFNLPSFGQGLGRFGG